MKSSARVRHYEPTPKERAARAKELLAERTEKLTRPRILNAIRKKLPATLSRPDLEMATRDYFGRLGHDNHRRLYRVYRWEEKKTKAAWGGSSVDYQTIGEKAVRGMSTPEVQQSLVVCSLVSGLYCPGYNPRQVPAKDSDLACAAARYKINAARLAIEARSELSAKKVKGAALSLLRGFGVAIAASRYFLRYGQQQFSVRIIRLAQTPHEFVQIDGILSRTAPRDIIRSFPLE